MIEGIYIVKMASLQSYLFLDVKVLLLGIILLLVLLWFLKEPKNLPPGPWRFPLIGSIPALAWEIWGGLEPHQIFQKYAARYGPVFRLQILNKTVVILNDFASIKKAFLHPNLQGRPNMQVMTESFRGSGLISASGEPWAELRRLSLTVFRSFGVGTSSFEEKIATEAEELIKALSVQSGGKPFDPKFELSNVVSNVICSVCFGKRYEHSDKDFRRLLHYVSRSAELTGSGGAVLFFPSLRHLPFVTKELLSNFEELRQFLENIVDNHRASFDPNNLADFTDVLLNEMEPDLANGKAGTQRSSRQSVNRHKGINIVGIIAEMFLAGTESTASTLQWSILYMVAFPDIQQRVQKEIDEVVGRNRLPRLADKPQLNFTQAVISETQRLGNIIPNGVAHAADEDTNLGDYTIKKGSYLLPNIWAVFQDPTVWPEPEKMKPERFLDVEGKVVKMEELIPFSIGRRTCLGDNLAKMELFIFFSYMMHQFTFTKPDNSPPLVLKGTTGISHPPLPFEICAIKRD